MDIASFYQAALVGNHAQMATWLDVYGLAYGTRLRGGSPVDRRQIFGLLCDAMSTCYRCSDSASMTNLGQLAVWLTTLEQVQVLPVRGTLPAVDVGDIEALED